jgi:hypothetical protein
MPGRFSLTYEKPLKSMSYRNSGKNITIPIIFGILIALLFLGFN